MVQSPPARQPRRLWAPPPPPGLHPPGPGASLPPSPASGAGKMGTGVAEGTRGLPCRAAPATTSLAGPVDVGSPPPREGLSGVRGGGGGGELRAWAAGSRWSGARGRSGGGCVRESGSRCRTPGPRWRRWGGRSGAGESGASLPPPPPPPPQSSASCAGRRDTRWDRAGLVCFGVYFYFTLLLVFLEFIYFKKYIYFLKVVRLNLVLCGIVPGKNSKKE